MRLAHPQTHSNRVRASNVVSRIVRVIRAYHAPEVRVTERMTIRRCAVHGLDALPMQNFWLRFDHPPRLRLAVFEDRAHHPARKQDGALFHGWRSSDHYLPGSNVPSSMVALSPMASSNLALKFWPMASMSDSRLDQRSTNFGLSPPVRTPSRR